MPKMTLGYGNGFFDALWRWLPFWNGSVCIDCIYHRKDPEAPFKDVCTHIKHKQIYINHIRGTTEVSDGICQFLNFDGHCSRFHSRYFQDKDIQDVDKLVEILKLSAIPERKNKDVR